MPWRLMLSPATSNVSPSITRAESFCANATAADIWISNEIDQIRAA